jgi:CHASE2 domain-containing sensor protein
MVRRFISFLSGFLNRRQMSFAVYLLAACLITLALEYVADNAIQSGNPRDPGLAPSVFEMSAIYQRVVASGPRKPATTFIAIVEIDPKEDPSLHNVCMQRKFVAELVRAVSAFSPAVIVIDKYYVTKCGEQDKGTAALQLAVEELGSQLPIVIGRRVNHVVAESGKPARNSLVPSPEFGEYLGVIEGIVNIDPDTKRLPLGWTVSYDHGEKEWHRSIALAAAEAYDPKLLIKYRFLQELIAGQEHPYISFLDHDQLKQYATYSTSDILCAREATRAARSCPVDLREDLSYLRGRIVIIAERDMDSDSHLSVLGHVPGFVLQANYIEALLDRRYFKPVGWWTNYGAGFLIFLAFHWVLIKHQHALEAAAVRRLPWLLLKAAFWCLVVILATIAALYLIVMHAGWYVNPATMGLVAFVMKFAELIFGLIPRGEGEG